MVSRVGQGLLSQNRPHTVHSVSADGAARRDYWATGFDEEQTEQAASGDGDWQCLDTVAPGFRCCDSPETMTSKERSKESMRGAILAKLIAVAKQKPEQTRPKILSSKAITELIDQIESKVDGWIKRTAHLEKARTFQSALQQARNHQIDVACLTVEEKDKKNSDKKV